MWFEESSCNGERLRPSTGERLLPRGDRDGERPMGETEREEAGESGFFSLLGESTRGEVKIWLVEGELTLHLYS